MKYIYRIIDEHISDFVDELDDRYVSSSNKPLFNVFSSVWSKLVIPLYRNFNR